MSTNFNFIDDLTDIVSDIPTDSIISRTFHEDDHLKAILFGFAQGQVLSEHTASQPAILHFLQGEAQLTLGEDVRDVEAGAWVHMPAHLQHSVQAKTQTQMLLLLFKDLE